MMALEILLIDFYFPFNPSELFSHMFSFSNSLHSLDLHDCPSLFSGIYS